MARSSLWWFVTIAIAALAMVQWHRNRESRQEFDRLRDQFMSDEQAALETAYGFAGQVMNWPASLMPMDQAAPLSPAAPYRLVLAYSEFDCDACRDQETRFLQELPFDSNAPALAIVVHASERYIRSFQQGHQLNLPVWRDANGHFFEANRIRSSPLLLLLNDRNEILAAHQPQTKRPWLSEPFHNRCRVLFDGVEDTPESTISQGSP